jgi:hypothetical protein
MSGHTPMLTRTRSRTLGSRDLQASGACSPRPARVRLSVPRCRLAPRAAAGRRVLRGRPRRRSPCVERLVSLSPRFGQPRTCGPARLRWPIASKRREVVMLKP